MAKITILEKDLTKASFQISPTDVAYVPGLSVNENCTKELLLCKSVADFEKEYGTMPAILDDSYITKSSDSFDVIFEIAGFKSSYQHDMKYIFDSENGWYYIDKLGRRYVSDFSLRRIGIHISGNASTGDFIETHLVYDLSYIYAKELIQLGIPVIYQAIDKYTDISVDSVTNIIKNTLYDYSSIDGIMDRGEYSIKYITSGGYPSFLYSYNKNDENEISYDFSNGFASKMLTLAGRRGDCVALIDATSDACGGFTYQFTDESGNPLVDNDRSIFVDNNSGNLIGDGSLWEAASTFANSADYLEYGAIFTPWFYYKTQSIYHDEDNNTIQSLSSVLMPPSFAYLITLAKSIRTNGNWYSIAGVARGQVPYFEKLNTSIRLSNYIANLYQPRNGKTSINAITNIKPYGYLIWGNRTMKNNLNTAEGGEDGLTATSFLNIRNMVSDIKKTAYNAAKRCIFEQNSDVLWVNFCSLVQPLLDKLISGQGLSNYKIIKQPTNEKAKLKAKIVIYPIYAVEDFEITIELSDQDVSVI